MGGATVFVVFDWTTSRTISTLEHAKCLIVEPSTEQLERKVESRPKNPPPPEAL
ncbi:hypothetical protein CGRA01v4_15037 [Colletotrichum graminicola]|uniref:Uncharacterized protein n=1 Tax=Colletotrichum graminicola (strain M1.001 / M2 / FGSC 10212) TaxID=645133 RepID=E3R0H9_COLGM|nr:uncharacterized protein GLRG_11762 [Colletotrichum graminicola M1.001]EFQ36617.1 hypothetical protein GLRG_11762 [Colletotrichum graminicola M1.001]WDK23745.1 hypothetical protein CGRA01v4_15037 [Colletotrichum graminicola]